MFPKNTEPIPALYTSPLLQISVGPVFAASDIVRIR